MTTSRTRLLFPLCVAVALSNPIGASAAPQDKKPSELDAKQLEALWQELAGDDAAKAYKAIFALAESPKQSVPFLAKHLKPVPPVDPKKLDQLIKDLGSDKEKVSDAAVRELEKLGPLARQPLERVLEGKPNKEVRR